MKRILLAFISAALVCGFASAQEQKRVAEDRAKQEQEVAQEKALAWRISGEFEMQDAGVMFGEITKGAPFTAQRTEESTQTLGDGTHITHKSSVSYARDGMGRVRREDDEWITIYDPVANISYRLNKKNHTGYKVELLHGESLDRQKIELDHVEADLLKAQAEQSLAEEKAKQEELEAQEKTKQETGVIVTSNVDGGFVFVTRKPGTEESLGSQVVNGVMADGKRLTMIIPAGDMGNDRPIQTVIESWYSPELHLTVLYKRTDPREGDETTQYTGIKRAEPNASLFQVPGGYTLRQERRRQEEVQ
jgi:hypothetical protein